MSATTAIPVPQLRPGVRGAWDRFVGPAASAGESAGTLGFAAVGLDIAGGAWCDETPSAKRCRKRAGRGGVGRVAFVALHRLPYLVGSTSGRHRWRSQAGRG